MWHCSFFVKNFQRRWTALEKFNRANRTSRASLSWLTQSTDRILSDILCIFILGPFDYNRVVVVKSIFLPKSTVLAQLNNGLIFLNHIFQYFNIVFFCCYGNMAEIVLYFQYDREWKKKDDDSYEMVLIEWRFQEYNTRRCELCWFLLFCWEHM